MKKQKHIVFLKFNLYYFTMKHSLLEYNELKQKVKFFYKRLELSKFEKIKGRKLALRIEEIITLAIYKHKFGINSKKNLYNIFQFNCSYKTLVVNLNRFAKFALLILTLILKFNQKNSHLIKHTDSTNIPVCLNKNARYHKTMKGLAKWMNSGRGWYYGLKLHLTSDFDKKILSIMFTPANVSDQKPFMRLNKDMDGIFIADSGYISKNLEQDFKKEIDGKLKRLVLIKPRKNMKKLSSEIQNKLYDTRMLIELNFRNLKLFHGLITSLPRSVNGYFANYIYSILSYVI
jgi:hypothetical protein